MIEILKEDNFDSAVEGSAVAVVDFFASWCMPCKMLAPILENASKEHDGKASFYKVDVDESSALARKFEVMSVPTVVFFKDGEPVHTKVGLCTQGEITDIIKSLE